MNKPTVLLLFSVLIARADIITTHPALANGDALFNNFTCNVLTSGIGAIPTDCSSVDVTTAQDSFGNLGIQFQSGFHDLTSDTAGEMLIAYDVTVVGALISDIHLLFNGNVTGAGYAEVVESVWGIIPATGIIGQTAVSASPVNLDASVDLPQLLQKAHVIKDIQWGVGDGAGTASISFIDQVVSQTGSVPEPGSMAMLGSALVALAVFSRRRRGARNG